VVGFNNLQENQILVDPIKLQYTINKDGIELVFTQCDVALGNVFIEDGAQNVKLNYSPIMRSFIDKNTVEVCNKLTVDADTDDDNVTEVIIDFGDSTTISSSPTFDGKILLPTITPVTIPTEIETTSTTTGSTTTTTTTTTTFTNTNAIELGNFDQNLAFNKPVRIEFPRVADIDDVAGFIKNPGSNEVTFITTSCIADSLSAVESQLAPGEICFIIIGSSFIIWTTHFTGFGTTTVSTSSSTTTKGGSGGGGGGGGGGSVSGDAPSYSDGYGGTLGPKVTGFGIAKFSEFIVQLDEGRKTSLGAGGCFVDSNQTLTISAIIDSKSPLTNVDLRVVHEGDPFTQYFGSAMTITKIPNEETKYNVSGTIPWEWMSGSDGIRFWINTLDEKNNVSESDKYFMSVKPGYSPLHKDLEVVTIEAEGTTLEPYAYITNTISETALGTISLVVNGEIVQTVPNQNYDYGTSFIPFTWEIPQTWMEVGKVVDYQIKVIGEFCEKKFETEEVTLSSFPQFITRSLSEFKGVDLLNNTAGKTIAGAESIQSSDNDPSIRFTVTSPDGTCVIGKDNNCKIKESTLGKRGNTQSITIDNQIYRVEYSGSERETESFKITSVDPIHGEWKINGSALAEITSTYRAIISESPETQKPIIVSTTTGFAIQSDALPWWLFVVVAEIIAGIIITMVTGANQNRYFLQEIKADLAVKSRKTIKCLI